MPHKKKTAKLLFGKHISSMTRILPEFTLYIYVKYVIFANIFVHRCEDVEYEQQIYPGKFFSKTNTNKQHKKMDKTEL